MIFYLRFAPLTHTHIVICHIEKVIIHLKLVVLNNTCSVIVSTKLMHVLLCHVEALCFIRDASVIVSSSTVQCSSLLYLYSTVQCFELNPNICVKYALGFELKSTSHYSNKSRQFFAACNCNCNCINQSVCGAMQSIINPSRNRIELLEI